MSGILPWLSQSTPGTVGIWMIVVAVSVHFFREWRLTRKLSLDDRLARRDGYAAQVTSLQVENRQLRNDLDARDGVHFTRYRELEQKYDDYRALCQQNEETNRNEIRLLHDQLTGFKRAMAAMEIAAIRAIPEQFRSMAAAAAAEKLAEYLDGTKFSITDLIERPQK